MFAAVDEGRRCKDKHCFTGICKTVNKSKIHNKNLYCGIFPLTLHEFIIKTTPKMDILKKEFASKLLKVKAIKLQPNDPFTWASGWKSPFYCDNRKTLSFPELRNYVELELVHAILEQFPEADAVAGVATGAIAQGALVADELNMPFVYVRSKPKDHGMQNLIEGQLDPKAKVVVVEDLISTGGSSLKAVEALRKNGNEIV